MIESLIEFSAKFSDDPIDVVLMEVRWQGGILYYSIWSCFVLYYTVLSFGLDCVLFCCHFRHEVITLISIMSSL